MNLIHLIMKKKICTESHKWVVYKVIGKFKDEINEKILQEFIGLAFTLNWRGPFDDKRCVFRGSTDVMLLYQGHGLSTNVQWQSSV